MLGAYQALEIYPERLDLPHHFDFGSHGPDLSPHPVWLYLHVGSASPEDRVPRPAVGHTGAR